VTVAVQRAEEAVDLVVRPSPRSDVLPQALQRVRVAGQFAGSCPAEEGGAVTAVHQPLPVLPGDEARRALGDGHQHLPRDVRGELSLVPAGGTPVLDAPRTQPAWFPGGDRTRIDVPACPAAAWQTSRPRLQTGVGRLSDVADLRKVFATTRSRRSIERPRKGGNCRETAAGARTGAGRGVQPIAPAPPPPPWTPAQQESRDRRCARVRNRPRPPPRRSPARQPEPWSSSSMARGTSSRCGTSVERGRRQTPEVGPTTASSTFSRRRD
jgi:hypothetical protein